MKNRPKGFFSTAISRDQAKDSGMAVVLILLVAGFFTKDDTFFWAATAALLVDMTFPMFYYPFAIFWYGLAGIMGHVMSRILLTAVYFLIVLPVALARRLMGKDPLLLRKFKTGGKSVLIPRDKTYAAADLERPF